MNMRFDEAQWFAAIAIGAKQRQESVNLGMENISYMIAYEAKKRCPVSTGNLENDFRFERTGNGWGKARGEPWEGKFYTLKIIWGENTDYSSDMDLLLEVGESIYSSTELFSPTGASFTNPEKPSIYRLRRFSVLKDRKMMAQEGIHVGGRFLQRAFKDNRKRIKEMQDTVFAEANRIIDRSLKKGTKFARRSTGSIAYASAKYKQKVKAYQS